MIDYSAYRLAAALGGISHLLVEIAFLVVALAVLRPVRRDAALLIGGAAGLELFATITSWLVYTIGSRYVFGGWMFYTPGSSMSSWGTFYAAMSFGNTLMVVLAKIMLLVGIVRLAKPERGAAVDPGRYE